MEAKLGFSAAAGSSSSGLVRESEREDAMLMNLAKELGWKRCPFCCFYVEKVSGCLSIKCRCGHTFCYGCGATMTMDHYCTSCKR